MRRLIPVLLLFVCMVLPLQVAHSETGIAAVVNDDAISMKDLNDRLRLVMISSGLPNTAEIRSKMTDQVMGNLIEEQLRLQEAERLGIEIPQEEVVEGFGVIAQQNNMTPEQFQVAVTQSGVNISTMYRQIRAQIAWNKIVQQQMRPQISITETDVDAYLERIMNNKGKAEYLVAEIVLPVEDPGNESNVRELASRLVGQINSGQTPFFKLAQQFSKTAGASKGGDLGWVQQGSMSQEVEQVLATMEPNKVSAPIRTTNGYHIVLLREKRMITDETLPSSDEVVSILGLQRLERMARRYLLDLKSSAFIEKRIES